jgi:hypothetical protein
MRRRIRLGDKDLTRGRMASLAGVFGLSLALWWALIMAAIAIVRRWWGS